MKYHKRNKLIDGYKARKHPLYSTWSNMKDRCNNHRCSSYKNYGGRGIKVCKRWLESFANFALDMGLKSSKELTLEREDNNGDYEPSNCKWATRKEQGENKRTYKTSSTGYSGIRLTKSGGFQVRSKGSERKALGVFATMKEAIVARENEIPQTKPRINNTTGYKGVSKQDSKFLVRKTINGKRVYLGNTKTLEEAIALYESGIKKKKDINNERDESGRYTSKNKSVRERKEKI